MTASHGHSGCSKAYLLYHGILVLGVAALLGTATAAAAGASSPTNVIDQNVHGTNIGALQYRLEHASPVTYSGQEVCDAQYGALHATAFQEGYLSSSTKIDDHSAECGYEPLWQIVGSGGDVDSRNTANYPSAMQSQTDIANGTTRAITCVNMHYILLQWTSCTTHIAPDNSVKDQQIDFFRAVMDLGYSIGYASGDFNAVPSDPAVQRFYWYYREADSTLERPTYAAPPPYAKIDYVFLNRSTSLDGTGYAELICAPPGTYSDHCFVHGNFLLN